MKTILAAFAAVSLLTAARAQTPPPPTPAPDSPAGKQLTEGRQVIIAAYSPFAQKYSAEYAAMQALGGVSSKGLATKEDIAARRTSIAACVAANEEILKFLNTQADVLRAELPKVGMDAGQIAAYAANFTPDPVTPQLIENHTLAQQTLRDMDAVLAALDESVGRWKADDAGKLSFKKDADLKKYRGAIDALRKSIAAQIAGQGKLPPNDLESPAPKAPPK